MSELIKKADVMRIINAENAVVLNNLKERSTDEVLVAIAAQINGLQTSPAGPTGHWIECDYKHLEHGFMETEPNAGLCCSNCRAAFQKKKMTYKQFCAACGAKMGAEEEPE